MRKLALIISIAAILCTIIGIVGDEIAKGQESGTIIELRNTSQDVKIGRVFWVDHPWRNEYPIPAPICMAELQPGESFAAGESTGGYKPGIYIFSWEPSYKEPRYIKVSSDVSKITVTDKFEITIEKKM